MNTQQSNNIQRKDKFTLRTKEDQKEGEGEDMDFTYILFDHLSLVVVELYAMMKKSQSYLIELSK